MTMYFSDYGLEYLLNNAISGSTDIRAAVFKSAAPSASTFAGYQYLSAVTGAHTEAAASGYSRASLDLASVTLTNQGPTTDKTTLTATAPSLSSVAAGETWYFIVYFVYNASDAAAPVICMDVPSSTLVTNGGNITLPALSVDFTAGAGNFTTVNRGLYLLLNLAITGSTDLRCVPFTGTKPSAAVVKDWVTLADAIADASSAEANAGASSWRYDLASVTVTRGTGGSGVTISAGVPTWNAVPAGETWTFLVYYIEGASDSARDLVAVDLTTSGQVTNGSNISYSALSLVVND